MRSSRAFAAAALAVTTATAAAACSGGSREFSCPLFIAGPLFAS